MTVRVLRIDVVDTRRGVALARGGCAGVANVGSSVLFAGVSGSAAADTAAVGGVLILEMKRAWYRPDFAAAVIAASATLGPIISPSLLMII